jgi:hypothetical protein
VNAGQAIEDSYDLAQYDQLTEDEFANYFEERGNRLFHSHGTITQSHYLLPVDAMEQHVCNIFLTVWPIGRS